MTFTRRVQKFVIGCGSVEEIRTDHYQICLTIWNISVTSHWLRFH